MTRRRVEDRFPQALAARWTPLPEALMDLRQPLGLGSDELLIVWALERHRQWMGDLVYPGRDRLAALTGLSIDRVKRATGRLEALGLVNRSQPGARGRGGRAHNHLDLDPLWLRLAIEVAVHHATATPGVGEHHEAATEGGCGAKQGGVAVQNEGGCGAPRPPEVDVEVEAEKKTPPPPSAAALRKREAVERPTPTSDPPSKQRRQQQQPNTSQQEEEEGGGGDDEKSRGDGYVTPEQWAELRGLMGQAAGRPRPGMRRLDPTKAFDRDRKDGR